MVWPPPPCGFLKSGRSPGIHRQGFFYKASQTVQSLMLTTRLRFIEPQPASPVDQPPEGKHWIHEIKHDGNRSQVWSAVKRVFSRATDTTGPTVILQSSAPLSTSAANRSQRRRGLVSHMDLLLLPCGDGGSPVLNGQHSKHFQWKRGVSLEASVLSRSAYQAESGRVECPLSQ